VQTQCALTEITAFIKQSFYSTFK